jgi:hypothetical protein
MTKQAERPITVSFIDDSSCTFDSNDFVEFEILTHDLPMGEIVFNGMPYNTGLTELGRCVFDYCDHGLYVYQDLACMLYEAQHPWLDYADAVEKMAFEKLPHFHVLTIYSHENDSSLIHDYHIGTTTGLNALGDSSMVVAFKPIKGFDFYHFNQVKVYTP